MTYSSIEVRPISGALDAEIAGVDLSATLSPGLRRMLDGLEAMHSAAQPCGPPGRSDHDRANRETMKMAQTEESLAEVAHPVVRTHPETGRKSLFVSPGFTTRFKDMTTDASAPLLDYLFARATYAERTCRFRWEKGSGASWVNRCTLHFVLDDDRGQRRVMHRVTVNGDRPV